MKCTLTQVKIGQNILYTLSGQWQLLWLQVSDLYIFIQQDVSFDILGEVSIQSCSYRLAGHYLPGYHLGQDYRSNCGQLQGCLYGCRDFSHYLWICEYLSACTQTNGRKAKIVGWISPSQITNCNHSFFTSHKNYPNQSLKQNRLSILLDDRRHTFVTFRTLLQRIFRSQTERKIIKVNKGGQFRIMIYSIKNLIYHLFIIENNEIQIQYGNHHFFCDFCLIGKSKIINGYLYLTQSKILIQQTTLKLMQHVFDASIKLLGVDRTAYLSWGVASIFWVFGFMYVSEHGIDSYSSNLSRGIMLVLFNLPVILKDKTQISPTSTNYMMIRHGLLVVYGFIFAQCFFYLPINIVHTLYSSGPIFVLIIDYLINRIEITKKQMIGAFISFFGVLLTVNGHILYQIFGESQTSHSQFKHYRPQADLIWVQFLVCGILIIGTFGWAFSIVITKKVKAATHYHLNFQYGWMMVLFAGLIYENTSIQQNFRFQAFTSSLIYQGLPLAIGQAFFSNAVKLTKNHGIMTMVGFIGVVLGYLIKIFRYKQQLNIICLIGSVLIMIGIAKVVIKQ